MKHHLLVSVVVPLDNDHDILPGFIAEIDRVMRDHFDDYELIFVDDGSCDGTRSLFQRAVAEIACLRYFRLTRPFGLEVAIACGLEQAIGDVIVVLNPAVDPPRLIPRFVQKASDTDGIVVGVKTGRAHRPLPYRVAYAVYFSLCRLLLERSQLYGATHFIGLTRTALNALLKIKDSFRYIRVLAMYAGFSVTAVPYEHVDRRTPPRRRSLLPLLAGAGNMIVSNSDKPLRVAAMLSATMSAADLIYIIHIVAVRLFWTDIEPGWASTNFFSAVMFFAMFVVLAMLCLYLAEIRSDIKSRPLYVVQVELQSDVMLRGEKARNVVAHEDSAEILAISPMRGRAPAGP